MTPEWTKNTPYFSSLLSSKEEFNPFFEVLSGILKAQKIPFQLLPKTNDIWARDYMPIQIERDDFLEYRYDPDYLLSVGKQDRGSKTYPDLVCDALGLKTRKTDLILDGGNVINSSSCLIMTDKVVRENRYRYSKKALIAKLHEEFKAEKVILTPWDRLDYLGHIDGVLRFIDEETVLINDCYNDDFDLIRLLRKNGLKTEFLNYNVKKSHKDNWIYINFLQTKDIMIIPTLGADEDEQALNQLTQFFPSYQQNNRIIPLRSETIIQHGGALNCISWTVDAF
ncbi:MAG: agmatine deiminase family protein [Cecembia sp.]